MLTRLACSVPPYPNPSALHMLGELFSLTQGLISLYLWDEEYMFMCVRVYGGQKSTLDVVPQELLNIFYKMETLPRTRHLLTSARLVE